MHRHIIYLLLLLLLQLIHQTLQADKSELILDIKYKNQMNWPNFTEEGAVAAATLRHLVNKCGKGAIRIYAD